DDWGRVGVRDQGGRDELACAGVNIGARPYDFYSLETADDLGMLAETLGSMRDSTGQPPCLEMNFIVAKLNFPVNPESGISEISLKPLVEGLPGRWSRPGLFEAYREGIRSGVFCPALHGAVHFCLKAVKRELDAGGNRSELLRDLWKAETPYIHWRMPWVGYEYWDPEQSPTKRFISEAEQERWIRWAAEAFRRLFNELPVSACAPGYRADATTHRLWRSQGVRVAQSGSGLQRAPHFDQRGLLHTYRSIDFEPVIDGDLSVESCMAKAEKSFLLGLPLIVSVHSINFHSSLAPFRQKTLPMLRELLGTLVKKFPGLLFVNDRQLLEIVETGGFQNQNERIQLEVKR